MSHASSSYWWINTHFYRRARGVASLAADAHNSKEALKYGEVPLI